MSQLTSHKLQVSLSRALGWLGPASLSLASGRDEGEITGENI